jgi:hypothetical protein
LFFAILTVFSFLARLSWICIFFWRTSYQLNNVKYTRPWCVWILLKSRRPSQSNFNFHWWSPNFFQKCIITYKISDASSYESENFDQRVRLRTSGTLLTSFIMVFRSRVIYDVLWCNYCKKSKKWSFIQVKYSPIKI